MTRKQEILRKNHGTPTDFAESCWNAIGEISADEAKKAIWKYQVDYSEAGHFIELTRFEKITSSLTALDIWVKARKFAKIALTNGCFDVLHPGHVRYLQEARDTADYLIVLLNTDRRVHQLKGPMRPINMAVDRATILSAMDCVDLVFIFDDKRIAKLLHRIKPAVWVKGGDYDLGSLDRSEVKAAKQVGARIKIIPLRHSGHHSTTRLYEKIANAQAIERPTVAKGHRAVKAKSRRLQKARSR